MPKISKRKKFDLTVLLVLLAGAALLSVFFQADVMISVVLYLLIPALYLCYREKKNYLKILLACGVLGILFGISVDLIAEYNNAWLVNFSSLPFSYRVFGVTPFGEFVWVMLVLFLGIAFYEHFLDDEKHPALSRHFLYALIPSSLLFAAVAILIETKPDVLHLPYAYLVLVGTAALPLLFVCFTRPRLLYKLLWLGGFFFVLNLIFELTALSLNQWSFSGQYIGTVRVLGLTFPIEELVLWIMLSTPTLIFYYEEFFDDGK